MVAFCQNGLTANDRSLIASFTVPGTTGKIALRKGWVSVVLLDWLGFWNAEIEPLVWPGVWGYAERLIRGSATELSNHAGGGAGDANAPQHPLGTDPARNFEPWQLAKMRARIPLYRGVLRSGAFYTGRKDGMHGEIDELANGPAVAAQIQTGWLAPGVRSYLTGSATAAPSNPSEEDLLAAIQFAVEFITDETGTVWECDVMGGTRVRIASPQIQADREHRLDDCGVPWRNKGKAGRPDAFGIDLVSKVADEVQRRQTA